MEIPVTFERVVTFRTTVTAPDADAAYDWAMDLGDQLDGDPIAYGPVDDFSVRVPEVAVSA